MSQDSTAVRNARFDELMSILHSIKPDIYTPFDIYRDSYTSADAPIEVDIIVPKAKVQLSLRPVIVRIHGGFLITGSSLFPAWFSKWILDYAELHGAVIISPNYRLLPEVRGVDILQDMKNFWEWVRAEGPQKHLASIGRSDVHLDMSQLLLAGESAGGYLAIQSVLSQFVRPKAMITLYPMLDMTSDYYTKSFEKPICAVPNFPNSVADEFLASRTKSSSITEADPPSRLDAALAIVQNGRFLELMGDEPELLALDRIKNGNLPSRPVGETLLPPLYILHGENDSAVPLEGTLKLLKYLREVDRDAKLYVVIRPGDHGFDAMTGIEEGWMKAGLDFVASEWLSPSKPHI